MSITKKERFYYCWNIYKITFSTVQSQCLGDPHRYCFSSPLEVLQTDHQLANCFISVIQGDVKWFQWNVSCVFIKNVKVKWFKRKFSQNRKINVLRKFHVIAFDDRRTHTNRFIPAGLCPAILLCHKISWFRRHLGLAVCVAHMASISCEIFWPPGTGILNAQWNYSW